MPETNEYKQWLLKFNSLHEGTRSLIAESLLGRSLELYLDPTGKCNFRCAYCYESFALGRMGKKLIEAVKLFISDNMIHRRTLYIGWFGGEPMTALPVVEDITAWAQRFCSDSHLNFRCGMTTNGYLLDFLTAERLIEIGISSFQITLDGTKNTHDSVRKLANGRPTFDRIWENLLDMRKLTSDFKVNMRIHARKDNVSQIRFLLDDIESEFRTDSRFLASLHPLENLGGSGVRSIELLKRGEFSKFKKDIGFDDDCVSSKSTEKEKLSPDSEGTSSHQGQSVCYACKPNSFHIRADGSVGKCTVALDAEYNRIGQLDEHGKVVIDREKMSLWTNALISLDAQEMQCPLSKMGSC